MSETVAIKQSGIPLELLKQPSRRAVRRAGTLGFGLILGRLCLIPVAFVLLYLFTWEPIKGIVMSRGEVVNGHIESKTTSGTKKKIYQITYSYEARGQKHLGHRYVYNSVEFAQLQVGQSLPVRFSVLFGKYHDEALLGWEKFSQTGWDDVLAGLIANLLFASPFLYLSFLRYWFQKRLCRLGTPVHGRITRKRITRGRHSSYRLEYEFNHPRLGPSASHVDVRCSQWKRAFSGEAVTVLCYPKQYAHASIIYEYSDFECL